MSDYKIDGYTLCFFEDDPHKNKAFVEFPQGLYRNGYSNQNSAEELQLLEGTHVLSPSFRFVPFLLMKGEAIVGRAALTLYPKQPETAYLGFFEMLDDEKAAAALFKGAERFAAQQGCTRVVGPMNASFWVGYRMKTDRFDEPLYFGEPYNLPYYEKLWKNNGYEITDGYVSNHYRRLEPGSYQNPRYRQRLQKFLAAGYEIRAPRKEEWEQVIRDVYRLIAQLYSSFPGFSPIEEEAFIQHYSGLRLILDFSLCRMVYHQNRAVAFAITIPDYGTLTNRKISPWMLAQLLWKRRHSSRYVVLYVGVEPEHKGLGTAMVQQLVEALAARRAKTIGALIHSGKVTQGYARGLIESSSHYALFGKTLAKSGGEGV